MEDYPRTLEEFEGRFVTEQADGNAWPRGFACPRCGGEGRVDQPLASEPAPSLRPRARRTGATRPRQTATTLPPPLQPADLNRTFLLGSE